MPKENEKAQVNLNETLRLTVDVTVSYLSKNSLPAAEVPHFIQMIHDSLSKLQLNEKTKESHQLKPAVSIRKSITDKISLLEALMMDKNISKNFRREEIEFCLNPKNYLGAAPRMAEELLKNVK